MPGASVAGLSASRCAIVRIPAWRALRERRDARLLRTVLSEDDRSSRSVCAVPRVRMLSAWPISLVASPTAEEREAFALYTLAGLVRTCQTISVVLVLVALLWWPTDRFIFVDNPLAQRVFVMLRVSGAGMLLALALALTYLPFARKHPMLFVSPTAALAAVLVGHLMALLGGPSTLWPHFLYTFLFLGVPLAMLPLERLSLTATCALLMMVTYFAEDVRYLNDPSALIFVSFMTACVIATTYFGQMNYRLMLETFRASTALASLNSTLAQKVDEQTSLLHALAMHLDQAREAERALIAHELHDELGQELMALRYALELAHTRYLRDPTCIDANLRELKSLLTRTTETTRSLVSELRPRLLLEMGLEGALDWLVRNASKSDVEARLECPMPLGELEEAMTHVVFRVVQEAITNALHHANPKTIVVRAMIDTGQLHVAVRDDGKGFDAHANRSTASLGLVGMRERVRSVAGEFTLQSQPGEGTHISFSMRVQRVEASSKGLAILAPE